jgi:uncharacterized membrane protein YgaE (UPF0421/DUF939 family)
MHIKATSQKAESLFAHAGLTLSVFKTTLAAGISWWLATLLLPHLFPYLAPITALLIMNATVSDPIEKAIYRIIGVFGGVIVSLLIAHLIPVSGVAVFLSILIGMAFSTALNLNKEIATQIGVSSVMVLAIHKSGYGLGRILETIIGSIIAILINAIVVPPNQVPGAIKNLKDLSSLFISILCDRLRKIWMH